ncbi:pentatricopeptide repeat-containing protein At3g49170, chloroplastic [Rhododendron vialii]|uniref:pentatricopeptide repeat-containing protein At3g49170, chloroplastic n=1 Tax=Rhododendron vialii TaxID=182163 RepID=UPI00265D8338|nr:pentatricopeptide repeat-containing protein At3g49170, chloroplastic [Rhododendron vialii]
MINRSLPSPANLVPPPPKTLNPSSQKTSRIQTLKIPNFEHLKNRLIHQASVGHLRQAISTLDLMTQQGLTPDLFTYSLLLKSSIRTRQFHLGKLVHARLSESQLEPDSVSLNSLISLYSKNNDWVTANAIFENMGERRDVVSWSAMISCFSRNDMESKAISTFVKMLEFGECPNQFGFAAVIRACSNAENAWIGDVIFGSVIKTGYFESDVCIGCALIEMFAKGSGDFDSAKKVFDRMPDRNSVSWTLMITRYSHMGNRKEAVELFIDMVESGYMPDKFTFTSLVSACAELGILSFGQQLHAQVVKYGLAFDVCVGCSLVDMYAKCAEDGSMVNSRKVFDVILDHNVISWTSIITGCGQSGKHSKEAIELYCRMIEDQVLPNHFTFSSLFKACSNLSDPDTGEQIYAHVVKMGLAAVNCVGNALISMYVRSGRMEDARKAFDILFEKNLVSYNTIVDGCTKNIDSNEAFGEFHQIEDTGFVLDSFTFASLLSGAASIGAVAKGEQIHARLLKAGFESNQLIANTLVSMYSRCGTMEAALRVYFKMERLNVVSWTSIITGLAKHGFATRALEMFQEMLNAGIKPNEVTYIAVLSACSYVGMIDEGWKHFNSMYKEYGISPRMEHYACMVDLLGRSSFLEEAMQLINSMPFEADALVWRTLLGACRVHGNIALGKQAAEMVIEKEPNDSAGYILLSNLYASMGQWNEVAEIRKTMKKKNLGKEAGSSWIEIENTMHKFHVGDTSHPQAEEIYKELDQLVTEIKEVGYVPDTSSVLQDVEDEQKEEFLLQHSEKIAVTFGLINTSKPKRITVFKNLRVCGDCHNAMKYISMVKEREIVLRDSNRFHHFKNGICSCNDYW